MAQSTPYSKTQDFTNGKVVVETVSDASTEASLEAEFAAIALSLSGLNAIYNTTELTLRGALDMGLFGIRRVTNINSMVFFIDGYGAVGDGTTDDRAAFIAAINAARAAGGGIVLLGPKSYLINTRIQASDLSGSSWTNTIIMGCGKASNIIKGANANDLFSLGATGTSVQIKNLSFTAGSSTGGLFIANAASFCEFSNLWCTGAAAHAGILSFQAGTNTNAKVSDIYFTGGADGDLILAQGLRRSKVSGINLEMASGTPGSGIVIDSCDGVVFRDINIVRTAGDANEACIYVGSNTGEVVINGFTLTTSVTNCDGIFANSAANLVLSDGRIFVNTNDAGSNGIDAVNSVMLSIDGVSILGNGASAAGAAFDLDSASSPRITGSTVKNFQVGVLFRGPGTVDAGTEGLGVGCLVENVGTTTAPTNFQFDVTATTGANRIT